GTAVWQKIADQLPPGSEFAERVQASIAEARERVAGARAAPAPAASATNVAAAARPASAAHAASGYSGRGGTTVASAWQGTAGDRTSKSGNAIPHPGALAGETTGVTPGAKNVAVRIGS